MVEEQLIPFASQFLQDNYQIRLGIPIVRNNRLRTSHGRFIIRNNRADKIELAGYLIDYGADECIIGVLKHECIHYALFTKKIGHRDGDPTFEKELKKHGAPRTNTLQIGKYYRYKCNACHCILFTKTRRVLKKPQSYRTSCCQSTLTLLGEIELDGT